MIGSVAICIVGYRNAGDIRACVEALLKSTYKSFEIVICENGGSESYDLLMAALEPFASNSAYKVRALLAPTNFGYAGGVNRCMEATRHAEAWWVLNPDTVPTQDALEALIRTQAAEGYDLLGGVMHYPDGTVASYGGRWRPWLARAEAIGKGQRLTDDIEVGTVLKNLSYISGGSMLVTRRFRDEIGPMREDYFLYCEEVEWCIRGTEKGMRLGFAPRAHILHHQGTTTGAGASIKTRPKLPIYLDERNKLLVQRDCFPARLPVSVIASLLLIFARYGRRGAWAQVGYALQGWIAGILNRRGVPDWLSTRESA